MVPHEPMTAAGYAFGPFVLDTTRRTVWRDGVQVPLTGKAVEVLYFLLESRDRVVTKDEMLQRIWPDTFVQENNLARHVSTLRRALGQRPDQNDYILTVQGRGYRFVAPVVALDTLPSPVTDPAGSPSFPLALPGDQAESATAQATASEAPASVAQEPDPALVALGAGAGPAPLPSSRTGRRRGWQSVLAAVGTVAAVAAVALVALRGGWAPDRSAPPQVLHQLTYGPSSQISPTWSPDGQSLAYASDREGTFDIVVQRNDGSEPVRITTSGGQEWQPAWSPDGRWIAFRSDGPDGAGLFVVPPTGGAAQRVADFGFAPRWSPDSRRLLFVTSQMDRPRPRAFVVGLDGQAPREVRADLTQAVGSPAFAWHPDGRRISVAGTTREGQWTFVTGSIDGTDAIASSIPDSVQAMRQTLGLTVGKFLWAASGNRIYFEGRSHETVNIWTADIAPATLHWRGTLQRLTTGPGSDRNLSLSADGHRLAFETVAERTRIWSFPLSPTTGAVEGEGRPVTPGAAGEFDVAVSQDGQRLVYRTTIDGRQELWQTSLADGRSHRLLSDPASVRSTPRWSPDGASLTYLISARPSDLAGGAVRQPALAVMSTTGGAERILPARNVSELIPDDWSADGQSILGACRAPETGLWAVCLVSTSAASVPRVLASDPTRNLRNGRFSPDQQWITFTAVNTRGGTSTVYVRQTAGGPMIPVTDGRTFEDKAHWAVDGRTIYFVSNRGGFLNIWGRRFDPAAGQPRGDVFHATRFEGPQLGLATRLSVLDVAVTQDRMFMPITETSGQIWALEDTPR